MFGTTCLNGDEGVSGHHGILHRLDSSAATRRSSSTCPLLDVHKYPSSFGVVYLNRTGPRKVFVMNGGICKSFVRVM
jgi:hypothetical protein